MALYWITFVGLNYHSLAGNEMTLPTVELNPSVKEYYEGDRIELECRVRGNPTPTIRWQRGSNRPLPLSAENIDTLLIIESARIEDSGEYRQE